jgi:ketosteroid isomerase-like protein
MSDTTTTAKTLEIVNKFYDAALRADFSALGEIFHADIVSRTPASMPNAGVRRGRENVLAYLPGLFAGIDLETIVFVDIIARGERAAVFLEVPFTFVGESAPRIMPIVESFIVRKGLITEVMPYYFDTAAILAAATSAAQ